MSIRATILALCIGGIALVASASGGMAADVYVNGVKVSDGALKGTVFDNVSVRFDELGNVQIIAPGYRVEQTEPLGAKSVATPAPPSTPAPATGPRYWLVMNRTQTGVYKVLISANGSPIAEVDPNRRQYVVDITRSLQRGGNRVELTYLPIPGALQSTGDVSNVIVGLGASAADGTLTISRVLATHKQAGGRRSAEAVNMTFSLK